MSYNDDPRDPGFPKFQHKPTSAQATDNLTKFDVDFKGVEADVVQAVTAGLPTDDASRKGLPIFDGVVMYFPNAMAAIAHTSKVGNDQHNPGEPLHWSKGKSTDQRNTQLRHMIDAARGNVFDVDGVRHSAKAAWRALALLETEIQEDGLGLFREPAPVPTKCVSSHGEHICSGPVGHTLPHEDNRTGTRWIDGKVSL